MIIVSGGIKSRIELDVYTLIINLKPKECYKILQNFSLTIAQTL